MIIEIELNIYTQKNNLWVKRINTLCSLFLYLQCNNHFTNQEIELSKDELWDLFKVSYKHYQTEVINDRKIYNRYVNDLISYHLPVFTSDEEAIRKHFQNLFCVYELLTDRKDLVEKYFTKSTFEKTDFSKMLNEFNQWKLY